MQLWVNLPRCPQCVLPLVQFISCFSSLYYLIIWAYWTRVIGRKKNSFLKPCLLYILLFTLVSKLLVEEMACSGFVIILVSRWALHCFWPQQATLVVANGLTSAKLTSSSNLVRFGHLWDTNTSHCFLKSWISSCKFSSFSSAKYLEFNLSFSLVEHEA